MNLTYLPIIIKVASNLGPIVAALQALDKAVTENTPLDQHAKDVLTAFDALVGDVLKAL